MDASPPSPATAPPPAVPDDDAPDFTPVSTSRNWHDGWTARRKAAFLIALARLGLVTAAARSVGMSARSAYRLRVRDTLGSFVAAWDTALEDGRRSAVDTGIARAVEGELVPVFYRGRKVGEYVRFNNRLLIAALVATAPRAPAKAVRDPFGFSGYGN